jgi:hypothetical protein
VSLDDPRDDRARLLAVARPVNDASRVRDGRLEREEMLVEVMERLQPD